MTQLRRITLFLLISTSLAAQEPTPRPAPAGESAPAWTAEEGAALALFRGLAERRDALRAEDKQPHLHRVTRTPVLGHGYRVRFFVPNEREELVPAPAHTSADRWCAYAWPDHFGEDGTRAFFVASEGPVLVTDNRQQRYDGTAPPQPVAALGRGASGTLRNVQHGPGLGADGGFWQTVETLELAPCRVDVVDEGENPVEGVEIALLPASALSRSGSRPQGLRAPFAIPVGTGLTNASGVLVVRGPPARDVVVAVRAGTGWLSLNEKALQRTDEGLRLRIPAAAWARAQRNANESAAIATLKNIASAQAQCQASGAIDANGNGAGEYGFFGELSGQSPVRSDAKGGVGTAKIAPPVLSRAFANVQQSRVERSGYLFQVFLRSPKKTWVAEHPDGGGSGRAVDPDLAEVVWCCYAWPVDHGKTGSRAFFVNQMGDVLTCDNAGGRYSGPEKAPQPGAALLAGDELAAAANQEGSDGQAWAVIR